MEGMNTAKKAIAEVESVWDQVICLYLSLRQG